MSSTSLHTSFVIAEAYDIGGAGMIFTNMEILYVYKGVHERGQNVSLSCCLVYLLSF